MDMSTKEVQPSAKRRPPRAGMGRPAGIPNKTTTALKEAILLAAETVGEDGAGANGLTGYLVTLAKVEPKSFSSLLGRVLPMTLQGPGPNGEHEARVIVEFVRPGS